MRKASPTDPRKRKGLIIVNTGDGKGKSTAAFGLALRAAGKEVESIVYPPFGDDGHRLFFVVRPEYWTDVVTFLDRHLSR